MRAKLTPVETKRVVAIYFANANSPTKTAKLFNRWAMETHNPTRLNKKNVIDVIKRFNNPESERNGVRAHLYKKTTDEDILLGVMSNLYQQPGASIRKCADEMDLSVGTTHTIARNVLKLHPYRLLLVQELSEFDKIVRFEACHRLLDIITDEKEIIFTDECSFYTDGHVNRWNCVQWDYVRPDDFHAECTQSAKVVTVWGGLSRDHVFGPYFFPSTVNGDVYRAILSEFFIPEVVTTCGNLENIWFHQDGAPAHVANDTKLFLSSTFENRIISRDFPCEWPPRSPDLTPCDFFLWAEVKELVYKEPVAVNSVSALGDAIIQAFRTIRLTRMNAVRNAVLSVRKRMEKCVALSGGQLEHC
jgi:hypothetical protein